VIIWKSYKQERDYLMNLARVANTLLEDEHMQGAVGFLISI